MENEVWKDVVGYEGLYQVSNLGRLKSLEKSTKFYSGYQKKICERKYPERIICKNHISNGYLQIELFKNGKVKNSGRKTKQGTNFYINCLINIYKSNAKKRNVKFDLEYTDFEKLINGECYYCGDVKSNKLIKKNYKPFYYNGIDRVNNEIGYTKENCVSCCEFCNKAKRNITIDEFYNKCYKIVNKKIELDEKYFKISKERIEKIILEG